MSNKVIILMGLPGSGKSSFTKLLPSFITINQDKLGNRKFCENALVDQLSCSEDCIIDRTNITKAQRKYFIDIAKNFNAKIYCIFLDIPVLECIERAKKRAEHETLSCLTNSEEKIIEVISKFNNTLELPDEKEGFDEIYYITNNDELPALAAKITTG